MTNLFYKNRGDKTIRNKDITPKLFLALSLAISEVYGPDYVGHIYSGGQTRKGKRPVRRTGSVRHDDFGEGGRAADVHIYDKDMKQITGIRLAPLAQYWTAKKIGGVGIEMSGGGIHLDEWAKPPQRGGMFWYYDYGKGTQTRSIQQEAVQNGIDGIMPPLHQKPRNRSLSGLFRRWGAFFKGM